MGFECQLNVFSSRFSITWSHPGPVYHQRSHLPVWSFYSNGAVSWQRRGTVPVFANRPSGERGVLTGFQREMSSSQITSSGFQFLLHTPHDQLWALLLQYLEMSEVRIGCAFPHDPAQVSNPYLGTENGYRRSDQFSIHVVNDGAREGKWGSQFSLGYSADPLT